ncbi:MAG: DUF3352 domain-containing protein [Candidatus Sericytochromatia bacterium]
MLKLTKIATVSVLTSSILSLSSLAETSKVPDSYRFIPQDSLMAFDIKTSQSAWEIFQKNKTLKNINLIKELNKNNKNESLMDNLLSEETIKNMGENVVFSFSNLNFDKVGKNEEELGLLLVEEMKSSNYAEALKNKIIDAANKSKDYKRNDFRVGEIDVLGFTSTKKSKEKNKNTYFAFLNNYVIVSDSKDKINQSINSYILTNNSLANSPDFIKSYDKLNSSYQIQFYLNNKKFFSNIYQSKEMEKGLKALNINYNDLMTSNSSLFNLNMDSRGLFIKSYSVLDKTNEKAKMALDSKTSNFKKYTNMLPKNTLLYFSGSDFKKFGETISGSFPKTKDFDIEAISKELFGINVMDLVKNLEEDFALALFSNESSPIPGFALIMTPTDREKMISLVNSIKIEQSEKDKGKRNQKVKKAPIEFKFTNKSNYKDSEIFFTNEIPDMAELAIQPAYSFIGHDMILSSNQNVLKSMIDRNANPNIAYNLQGNESFSKAIKYFGEDNNTLGFINLSSIVNMVAPFMQKDKDLKTTFDQLKKLEFIGTNSSKDEDGIYGNFALFADMENLEFDKLIPESAKKGFTGSQTRAKVSSVKTNMHILQTTVETYGVDWTGLYPNNIEELKKEAEKHKYWKELKNPITEKTELGKGGSLINYSSYINHKANLSTLKGMVIYQPSKCQMNKATKKTLCEGYKIYGTDEKGMIIKEKGQDFYLSNM